MKEEYELIKGGIQLTIDFFKMLAGPAASEIGLYFQDQVKYFRIKNLIEKIKKVEKLLKESNTEPQEIPMRTLIPIIEGASIEDDELLSDMWVNLIANAAKGKFTSLQHPSWPYILRELSPLDAYIFNDVVKNNITMQWEAYRVLLKHMHNLDEEAISISFNNLMRLGLLQNTTSGLVITNFMKSFYGRVCVFENMKKESITK